MLAPRRKVDVTDITYSVSTTLWAIKLITG